LNNQRLFGRSLTTRAMRATSLRRCNASRKKRRTRQPCLGRDLHRGRDPVAPGRHDASPYGRRHA